MLIQNCRVLDPRAGIDEQAHVLLQKDAAVLNPKTDWAGRKIEGRGLALMPGFVDLHVHCREPGYEYKETIATAIGAALAGGVTAFVAMPNTRPVLDDAVAIEDQFRRANGIAFDFMTVGSATRGLLGEQMTDIAALKKAGVCGISDDGRPVSDDSLMLRLLLCCKEHNLVFMQHAENLGLSCCGAINESEASRRHGVKGQSPDAEGVMVERDIELVRQTKARYHVLHVSTARALNAVRKAKAEGLPVTCEVSPHHLLLSDTALATLDTNKKMNPPLRSETDRQALLQGLADGTIDAVASDHAPHAAEEKAQPIDLAPFGVVGLETLFSSVQSLVHAGIITQNRAVELLTVGPSSVLQRPHLGTLFSPSARPNACLIDLDFDWQVSTDELHSRSKNSAFLGMNFKGKVLATFFEGELLWVHPSFSKRMN